MHFHGGSGKAVLEEPATSGSRKFPFLFLRDDPSRGTSQIDLRLAASLVFHEAV